VPKTEYANREERQTSQTGTGRHSRVFSTDWRISTHHHRHHRRHQQRQQQQHRNCGEASRLHRNREFLDGRVSRPPSGSRRYCDLDVAIRDLRVVIVAYRIHLRLRRCWMFVLFPSPLAIPCVCARACMCCFSLHSTVPAFPVSYGYCSHIHADGCECVSLGSDPAGTC
uniref:Uncharacterized protein n=1 Tax=Anopheles atroparvus TaxID=41427 RepID=A0AAG5D5P7_ANOAO